MSTVLMFQRLEHKERDEIMARFREGFANFIITTDILARGFDLPDFELVINFEVPIGADPESYLRRIQTAGRSGKPMIVLNLLNIDQEKPTFDKIIEDLNMNVTDLVDEEQLSEYYAKINSE